jgi:arginine decarboxylase
MQETQSLHGAFLPKKFFIAAGSATSSVSPLNAFDAALAKAGIAQCNLVNVSSILPPDAEETKNSPITPGTVTFAVMARMDGDPGETIGAGIGWTKGVTSRNERYGLVAEAHGYKDKEAIERELRSKLNEMAKIRDLKTDKIETRAEFIEVPKGKYGTVIVALVFAPWTEEESKRPFPNSS